MSVPYTDCRDPDTSLECPCLKQLTVFRPIHKEKHFLGLFL